MNVEQSDRDAEVMGELRELYESRFGPPRTELIEAGRVRDYLCSMGEWEHDETDHPAEGDPVPPLFLLTLARTRRPQPSRGSAVNAGHEYQFLCPVLVGDRITTERIVSGVETKHGRRGPMYLVRAESTFTNQHDEVVATSRQSFLRWGL